MSYKLCFMKGRFFNDLIWKLTLISTSDWRHVSKISCRGNSAYFFANVLTYGWTKYRWAFSLRWIGFHRAHTHMLWMIKVTWWVWFQQIDWTRKRERDVERSAFPGLARPADWHRDGLHGQNHTSKLLHHNIWSGSSLGMMLNWKMFTLSSLWKIVYTWICLHGYYS